MSTSSFTEERRVLIFLQIQFINNTMQPTVALKFKVFKLANVSSELEKKLIVTNVF